MASYCLAVGAGKDTPDKRLHPNEILHELVSEDHWKQYFSEKYSHYTHVFIGKHQCSISVPCIQVEARKMDEAFMRAIHRSNVAANRRALFIIDDPTLKLADTNKIVNLIRKYNPFDPILKYTYTSNPVSITHNMIFIVGKCT